MEKSSTAYLQIKNVLNDVNKIEKESGTNIEEIKIGDVQISKNELSLKEIILKGNEHYYKKQYNEAIEWYDKALKQDSNNLDLLFNKAYSLAKLWKFNESIEWYDKVLKIKPDFEFALYNKGLALYNLGKHKEAIGCYDKALRIKPDYELALNNKRLAQEKLGKEDKRFFSMFRKEKR